MVLRNMRGLPLPAGVKVPAGAIQHKQSATSALARRELVYRSTLQVPLAEQAEDLSERAEVILGELSGTISQPVYLDACRTLGCFKHKHKRPEEHPANTVGLAAATTA